MSRGWYCCQPRKLQPSRENAKCLHTNSKATARWKLHQLPFTIEKRGLWLPCRTIVSDGNNAFAAHCFLVLI
jgi:hypothetical protein